MSKAKADMKKKAVALQYKLGFNAPRVVASGKGHVADKILETAKEADVKLYQDARLVEELSRVDIGLEIPPELYEVVAQVLVYIDRLDALEGMADYE